MAKNYSTRDFFRQMPNALLARYFHFRDLLTDFDFAGMKEAKIDELFDEWLKLPEPDRKQIDTEFREIFDMCDEQGSIAIMDEAAWQLEESPEALKVFAGMFSALPNHYCRAMTAFLDYKAWWRGATQFHHADRLPYWRKRNQLGHSPAAVDEASLKAFAEQIRDYFYYTEGRGKNCIVEPYRRGDRDYFFAYPEDYSQQSAEWVGGEFDRRPHNPAFEIVFVYSQKEGSLDLNFRGAKRAVEPLQSLFATVILKLKELPPDPKDKRVYELTKFSQKNFNFVFSPSSGINSIEVRKLRLSSRMKGEKIILEAEGTDAIYDLLDRLKKSISLSMYNVTLVELVASVAMDTDKPSKKVPFRITYPNSCSLKYDEIGLKLRDMLEASGIEPKEPPAPTDASA